MITYLKCRVLFCNYQALFGLFQIIIGKCLGGLNIVFATAAVGLFLRFQVLPAEVVVVGETGQRRGAGGKQLL